MQVRERAKEITGRMTLDEKIAQLYSVWFKVDENGKIFLKVPSGYTQEVGTQDPFEYLKNGVGQITRPLGSQSIDPLKGVKALNTIQKFLIEHTRLGIPALPHEECLSGLMARGATIFPSGLNNGSSWDPDLVRRIGDAIGTEVYAAGSRQGLAPVLDVCRDARWGRTEETFGEDPYLTGVLGSAYVKGFQDEKHPLIATLKHYVGHSFSEGGRNHAPVRIGKRELNDVFLFPFEMAVKYGGAASIMPAYHDIDGEPVHQSRELLNSILRDRWGFDGIIVSDYEGLDQLVSDHHTQPDQSHAAAVSIKAGVDVELPCNTLFRNGIEKALSDGLLEMSDIDEAVTRHLVQKIRMGLFENPYVDEGVVLDVLGNHREIALEAAEKSIVLLKNDGILPLGRDRKIALIGPLADEPMGMLGGYAFPVHLVLAENKDNTSGVTTVRLKLEELYGESLIYSKGCDILTGRPDKPAVFPGEVERDGSLQGDYISRDTSLFDNAVEAAMKADTVILAVGDMAGLFLSGTVGEGSDASSLTLPGVQQQLIDIIVSLGKPTVIIIFSGRPYHLGEGGRRAGAVIQAWLPGQEGAAAVSRIITGEVNPGGKLPISIPREAGAMPYYYNHKMKSAGTPVQKGFGAEYAFGFGCSYTEFVFEECDLEQQEIDLDGSVRIKIMLRNIGKYKGDEIVQIYVRDLYARYVRPVQELKAFQRVSLSPGETIKMVFNIPTDLLSYTLDTGERVVEPGDFDVMVGTSSQDIHKKFRIALKGKALTLKEEWRMVSSVELITE